MIRKKINDKIFINIKEGNLIRYYPETKQTEEIAEVGGILMDIKIIEKLEFNKIDKYKELRVELWDDINGGEYYVISSRLYKPFSDGLIFALANLDNYKEKIIIRAYNKPNPNVNVPYKVSFCSVRKYDTNEKVKWIPNIPPIKIETYKNSRIVDREERDAFINTLINNIREKIKTNQDLINQTKINDELPDEIIDEQMETEEDNINEYYENENNHEDENIHEDEINSLEEK